MGTVQYDGGKVQNLAPPTSPNLCHQCGSRGLRRKCLSAVMAKTHIIHPLFTGMCGCPRLAKLSPSMPPERLDLCPGLPLMTSAWEPRLCHFQDGAITSCWVSAPLLPPWPPCQLVLPHTMALRWQPNCGIY